MKPNESNRTSGQHDVTISGFIDSRPDIVQQEVEFMSNNSRKTDSIEGGLNEHIGWAGEICLTWTVHTWCQLYIYIFAVNFSFDSLDGGEVEPVVVSEALLVVMPVSVTVSVPIAPPPPQQNRNFPGFHFQVLYIYWFVSFVYILLENKNLFYLFYSIA